MMLQRAFTGACRSACQVQATTMGIQQRTMMMMMAGGDIPAPVSGTVKKFDSKKVRRLIDRITALRDGILPCWRCWRGWVIVAGFVLSRRLLLLLLFLLLLLYYVYI